MRDGQGLYDKGYSDGYLQGMLDYRHAHCETPRGEWINKKVFRIGEGLRYAGNCSKCGYLQIDLMWGNYCPKCGSDMMRGECN